MPETPPPGFSPFGFPPSEPLPTEPSVKESVRLECVAPDAGSALLIRLERYPELGRAWLWVVLCADHGVYAYHDVLRDPGGPVDLDAATARYEIASARMLVLGRLGPPGAVTAAAARVDVMAHEQAHAPPEDGQVLMSIDAAFHTSGPPLSPPIASQGAGLEITGDAEVAVMVGDREVYVGGRASWSESRRHGRPWIGPSTNVRLRGPGLSVVDTAEGPSGRIAGAGGTREVDEVSVEAVHDEPAAVRALLVRLADGTELEGLLATAYAWSLPLGGGRRRGTAVRGVLGGATLTGVIEEGDELLSLS